LESEGIALPAGPRASYKTGGGIVKRENEMGGDKEKEYAYNKRI
jgi:hypothetical protein